MNALKNLSVTAALLLASTPALAHAGHAHGDWRSAALQTLLTLALFAAASVGTWLLRAHRLPRPVRAWRAAGRRPASVPSSTR